jgi:phosphoglycerate dehydrogenase-like enzyme
VVPAERLEEVAGRADHLVIALPATPLTRNLVSEAVIRALPRRAALINVARPSVLDVDALVRALGEGRLSGALLDVHGQEPLPADSPLWDVDRLWVTPHGAFCYPGEAEDLAALVVENARRFAAGLRLRNQVDRSSLPVA